MSSTFNKIIDLDLQSQEISEIDPYNQVLKSLTAVRIMDLSFNHITAI